MAAASGIAVGNAGAAAGLVGVTRVAGEPRADTATATIAGAGPLETSGFAGVLFVVGQGAGRAVVEAGDFCVAAAKAEGLEAR